MRAHTKQMKVLNETYAPHGIQFTVAEVSHSVNDSWTTQARIRDKALALRRGGYDDLNLYFDTGLMTNAGSATGLCSFPVSDPAGTGINGTSWLVWDGCFVSPGTMPGGPGVPWDAADNKGKTATHEVGHWLGLFHVFEGFDCAGEGDMIDDTPATSVATVGCPVAQDSCPDQPGLDPVHNYMDYASHAWYVMGLIHLSLSFPPNVWFVLVWVCADADRHLVSLSSRLCRRSACIGPSTP